MVYIIILNWNGKDDTIECLESVFKSTYKDFVVIICDNNSSDKSIEAFRCWANKCDYINNEKIINSGRQTGAQRQTGYVEITKSQIDKGEKPGKNCNLVLIQNEGNIGFAAGNNVGIKYALSKNDLEYIWLLNNDTVIETDTLKKLVEFMKINSDIGIGGAVLLDYDPPHAVQAIGGEVDRKTGRAKIITDIQLIQKVDYIIGASLIISENCIQKIGLLPEEYFLYYEETDYCFKARENGFRLGVAIEAKVYHKEGRSTGISRKPNRKSELSDLLMIRNRIIFAKKYKFPILLVYSGFFYSIFLRILRGQVKRAVKCILLLIGLEVFFGKKIIDIK